MGDRPRASAAPGGARAMHHTSSRINGRPAVALTRAPNVSSATAGISRCETTSANAAAIMSATNRSLWPLATAWKTTTGFAPNATSANAVRSGQRRCTVHTIKAHVEEARDQRHHAIGVDLRGRPCVEPRREPARQASTTPARTPRGCSPRSGRRTSTADRSDSRAGSARTGSRCRPPRSGRSRRRSTRRARTTAAIRTTARARRPRAPRPGPHERARGTPRAAAARNPATASTDAQIPTNRTGSPGIRSSRRACAIAVNGPPGWPPGVRSGWYGRPGRRGDDRHRREPRRRQRERTPSIGGGARSLLASSHG